MKSLARKITATAAMTLAAAGATAGVAYADTTTPTTAGSTSSSPAGHGAALTALKARAATAVTTRVNALDSAVTRVNSNRFLTSSDKTTLLNTLNSDLSGLQQLGPKIQADTTLAAAQADYRTIFTNYRVFALALPQVHFAAAADDLTGTVVPHLTDAQTRLQKLLSGPDQSKNSASVQAAMADLSKQISAITSATNSLSSTVLGYTPSQWDANRQLLTPARQALTGARSAARTARQDVKTVVEAIKA